MTKILTRKRRPLVFGLVFLVVIAAVLAGVFNKQALIGYLRPGEVVRAEFSGGFKLDEDESPVKIAGTPVGTVTSVEQTGHGTVLVSMKVDSGTRAKLGSAPRAIIRPTTILGGRYYVSLEPGGSSGSSEDVIPVSRTSTPVELDQVLSALQPNAVQGLQATVRNLDGTLAQGSGALRDLVSDAPATLNPASGVLQALQGKPGAGLAELVTSTNSIATVLTRDDGQLARVLDDLDRTAATLAGARGPLTDTLSTLPETLRTTRAGLDGLHVTLDKLRDTAGQLRPAVRRLTPLLDRLDPVLVRARPVVHDLVPLLTDARPLVDQLVPTARTATGVLDDVKGPVLQRVNGPIVGAVNNKWVGQGRFAGGGDNGFTTYQELGFLVSGADYGSYNYDQNGHLISFQPGLGTNTVLGLPGNLDELLRNLAQIGGHPR